jgi:hypothetical protein
MFATLNTSANTANTDNAPDNGLSFEVREIEYEDDSVSSIHPGSAAHTFSQKMVTEFEEYDDSPQPDSPTSPFPLVRSSSASLTSPTARAFQCSPAMATTDGMYAPPPSSTTDVSTLSTPSTPAIRTHPNVKRLVFGENPETIATLAFLESQRIDTTALVTQHIMKYGSRARIAVSGDGDVVGFALFDNEIDQEQLRDMATYTHPKEIKQYVDAKPFIFLQMLIMDPHFVAVTNTIVGAEWKKELVAQFCDCVNKNGKIGIARTESDNQGEIEFYRECGFFTMHDMGIPSYPSSKGADISVLAYTPLGKEGTAEIFRKFYSMGARF